MARDLIDQTLPPIPEDWVIIPEVPSSHPLRRYADAMAKKLEIEIPPKIYISNNDTDIAYANPSLWQPENQSIVLSAYAMQHCSTRTIAAVLAHEMGHLTPENMHVDEPHKKEFMADACADSIVPGYMAPALAELMRCHFSWPRALRNLIGKPSHPSIPRRIEALVNREWHETSLKHINARRQLRLERESLNRAKEELLRRAEQQKPNPHHEERAFRHIQRLAEAQTR